jgi:hypothetical protein
MLKSNLSKILTMNIYVAIAPRSERRLKCTFFYTVRDMKAINGSMKPKCPNGHYLKKNRHLWLGRDDTIENKVYDSRTPGLFKLEYEGTCIISLASKMYYCDENKFSSKGINKKQNEITKQKYVDALKGNSTQEFVNNGFRVTNNQMNTYSLTKTGMKLFNDKRLRVGFQTFPTKL